MTTARVLGSRLDCCAVAGNVVVTTEQRGDDEAVVCYDRATGHFEHLRDVSALTRIKQNSNVGYNVLATASAFWEGRIRALSNEPARSQ